MDEYERTTRIRREEVVAPTPVVPVQATAPPVYAATPVQPAYAVEPAAPVADRVVREDTVVTGGPTGLELARRIVGLAFGVLQALLVLRIALLLLVANPDNGVVQFILGITDPFVNPFRDMFALDRVGSGGSVLDVAAIVALIAWTLVEMLILAILNIGARRRRTFVV
jgi:YggT family protein